MSDRGNTAQPAGGQADAGSSDAGSSDAGSSDAGSSDAGSSDAGSSDAGSSAGGQVIAPGATVGFVGLGRMGSPMAARLAGVGYRVLGYDVSEQVTRAWAQGVPGATAAAELTAVAPGAAAIVLMLPDSAVVTDVLVGRGLLAAIGAGTVVIDMSSSVPQVTRELATQGAAAGVALVDAPVSGGVRGAEQGSLTVMVGGAAADVARVRGLLDVLGTRVMHVGDVGAGHAVKALNNLMSATHLLATSEAMAAAAEFGLDIPTVLEAVNTSSGRSGSTENKWPNFIVPQTFDSGFALRLMLKDMRIALGLAQSAQTPSRLSAAAVELWAEAADALPPDADHTEIARWLDPSLTRHTDEPPAG
jgi:3-hydroxyisobutyrate dehydrogenase